MTIFFIPLIFLFFQVEAILLYLGQDAEASRYAQIYAIYFLPGLYMQVLGDIQRKFLNSLGKNSVPMIAQAISSVLHLLWSYILVARMDMGVVGTSLASVITNGLALVIMLAYTSHLDDIQEAVHWPDSSSFADLCKYLEIGIPCSLLLCSGYCAIHLLTFLTGYFSVAAQNAQIILLNVQGIFFMVSIGLWQAVATIIGQKIGNLEVASAKHYYKTIKLLGVGTYVVLLAISEIFKKQIVGSFT